MTLGQIAPTEIGNIINLVGALFVLIGSYYYFQFKKSKKDPYKRVYRQRTTAVILIFLFFSYATTIFFPGSGAWSVEIGRTFGAHLERMAQRFSIDSETPQPIVDQLLIGLKFIGLFAYLVIFTLLSIAFKLPVNLLTKIRNWL